MKSENQMNILKIKAIGKSGGGKNVKKLRKNETSGKSPARPMHWGG